MLDAIVDGILFHISFDKARREDQEERERRRQHMAERRDLHNRRTEREAKREEFLRKLASDQREANDLRATILHAQAEDGPTPEYLRMIAWAKERLATLEALNRMDILSSNLRNRALFPDSDELLDPEGDPPPRKNSWDD